MKFTFINTLGQNIIFRLHTDPYNNPFNILENEGENNLPNMNLLIENNKIFLNNELLVDLDSSNDDSVKKLLNDSDYLVILCNDEIFNLLQEDFLNTCGEYCIVFYNPILIENNIYSNNQLFSDFYSNLMKSDNIQNDYINFQKLKINFFDDLCFNYIIQEIKNYFIHNLNPPIITLTQKYTTKAIRLTIFEDQIYAVEGKYDKEMKKFHYSNIFPFSYPVQKVDKSNIHNFCCYTDNSIFHREYSVIIQSTISDLPVSQI